jgi:hypothetical protein
MRWEIFVLPADIRKASYFQALVSISVQPVLLLSLKTLRLLPCNLAAPAKLVFGHMISVLLRANLALTVRTRRHL